MDEICRQHFEYVADGLKEGEIGIPLTITPHLKSSPWQRGWKKWRRLGGKVVALIAFPLLSWWLQRRLLEPWESKVSKSLYERDNWGKVKGIKIDKDRG